MLCIWWEKYLYFLLTDAKDKSSKLLSLPLSLFSLIDQNSLNYKTNVTTKQSRLKHISVITHFSSAEKRSISEDNIVYMIVSSSIPLIMILNSWPISFELALLAQVKEHTSRQLTSRYFFQLFIIVTFIYTHLVIYMLLLLFQKMEEVMGGLS